MLYVVASIEAYNIYPTRQPACINDRCVIHMEIMKRFAKEELPVQIGDACRIYQLQFGCNRNKTVIFAM